MSIADLASNIQGSVSQLSGVLGLSTSDISPTYATSLDGATVPRSFQREHWLRVPEQSNYAFGVEVVEAGNTLSVDRFVNQIVGSIFSNNEFTDFALPISPQEISQSEDFAVSVKPTQGGTVVNHSGNKYKTLTISGTTGVHPFKGINGVDPASGVAFNQPDTLKYRSGYEVFQHFRAWIKGYHESKKFPQKENLRMIFRNFKDWEFLYVEPLKFTMKRDASRPLLYNYTINFRVLSHVPKPQPLLPFLTEVIGGTLVKADAAIRNTLNIFKTLADIFESTIGTSSEIRESYRRVLLALNRARGNPNDMSLVSSRNITENLTNKDAQALLEEVANKIRQTGNNPGVFENVIGDLSPMPRNPKEKADAAKEAGRPGNVNVDPKNEIVTLLDSLAPSFLRTVNIGVLPENARLALQDEQVEASTISREEMGDLKTRTEDLASKFAVALGLSDEQYNQTLDVTETEEIEIGEITDEAHDILYGLNQAIFGLDLILSNDDFFDINSALNTRANAQNGAQNIGQGIFRFPDPNVGVRDGIVPTGVTLERIAESELGDASRWTELAELNALKSPYIVDDTSSGFKVNYTVQSAGFSDPTEIQGLVIGQQHVVNSETSPVNAWSGKGNFIARYNGGTVSDSTNWSFFFPQAGTVVSVVDRDEYLQYTGTSWVEFDPDSLQADGVLRPGDTIILPTNRVPAPEARIIGPRDNVFTNDLNQAEKSLAVDLKLTEERDLDLLPSGDLNVSKGKNNGAQAIVLKLLYSRGSVPNFPQIGSSLGVGGKIPSVAQIRSEILSSLLQDTRIKDVSQINLLQQGNTINLSFQVFFKDVQDPVPITIPVG